MNRPPRRGNVHNLKPGSRRWQRVVEMNGGRTPKVLTEIGIDFVCRRHPSQVLGRFRLDTFEGGDPRFRLLPNEDGTLPETRGEYHKIALARCALGCRTDVVWKPQRVQDALDALYEPGGRRVRRLPV